MIRQSIVAKDFSAIGNPLDDSPETRERKASMGKVNGEFIVELPRIVCSQAMSSNFI
jgi:hypothetical protein